MAQTAIVRPNSGRTAQMTAKERLGEVATILAAGVVRLRNRATSKLEAGAVRHLQALAEGPRGNRGWAQGRPGGPPVVSPPRKDEVPPPPLQNATSSTG